MKEGLLPTYITSHDPRACKLEAFLNKAKGVPTKIKEDNLLFVCQVSKIKIYRY